MARRVQLVELAALLQSDWLPKGCREGWGIHRTMASSPRLARAARTLAAAVLLTGAAVLAGCSTAIDHIPTAIGGLPEGTPARPAEQAPYPAVHDMPPPRSSTPLTEAEKKLLKDDLIANRNRAIQQGTEATSTVSTEATGSAGRP
jgi:hypothetical protein